MQKSTSGCQSILPLLYVQGSSQRTADKASDSDLSRKNKMYAFGVIGRELVANMDLYQKAKSIDGSSYYTWRSGVKHDASSIMELRKSADGYMNGLGEEWQLEDECLFPLLKSSDIANKRLIPNRYVLLTQCRPSDDTRGIAKTAPLTWAYLTHHSEILDRRKDIIYPIAPGSLCLALAIIPLHPGRSPCRDSTRPYTLAL